MDIEHKRDILYKAWKVETFLVPSLSTNGLDLSIVN